MRTVGKTHPEHRTFEYVMCVLRAQICIHTYQHTHYISFLPARLPAC